MAPPGRVCARCARAKQRCDGASPCSRCARLGHICEPQTPGKRATDAVAQAYHRPRASRSRRGCLSCRSRKKKCDELRPRCSDCRRLNLPCRWRSLQAELPPSHALDDDPPIVPSNSSSVSSEPSYNERALSPVANTLPLSDGALAATVTPRSTRTVLAANPVASPTPVSVNLHLHTENDRSLFNHYLHIVSRTLSRSDAPDGNPFLTTLLPMAAASASGMLTSMILVLSGSHWKRVYPSIWNRAMARRGHALLQLSQLLNQNDILATLEACVAIVLLCMTELFDGSSTTWKWHLKAASALVESIGVHTLQSTREGTFCLQLFHYVDSMSTISRCGPPLLHGCKNLSDLAINDNPPTLYLTNSPFVPGVTISGIPPALLSFVGMVNLLAAHRDRRVDELSDIGFRAAATRIQSQLDTWRAEYDGPNHTLSVPENDKDHATVAFEFAIRLRLHQIVNGYDPTHAVVVAAIATIRTATLAIPYGSRIEGALLFPLVIAGASCTDLEWRMMVKERLMVMEHTLGFGHITLARQLLEKVWDQEDEWNWASVRYKEFPGVVFI